MPITLTARALLFDMDGTLVDSTVAVERIWSLFADRFGLDRRELLDAVHGVRMIDSVRRFVPVGTDADAVSAELAARELEDFDGVVAVSGAAEFLAALPSDRIAVVTSASAELASIRLGAAGIAQPEVFVTADTVERGKPDPEPFLAAAAALGVDPRDCLVFEDAEAGITAGLAAGARVVVVGPHESETTRGLPRIVDYRDAAAGVIDGVISLTFP
ncbi:HAD-IA family hydrolase [Herbiconiux sp. L3-i23]|uniref:HAD-IA family hydrolase n=1 Tax=Herbiconiux sp. L3-i23 TaxID=2905871 RepID=UPI00204C8AE8|nr:HAD-IA family hydrolase [Herbiconiux sp. L3-i23]BDI23334.1 hydrolase [Herbiconiux sp. L3-i23]